MRNLTKILLGVWLLLIFAMWNAGPPQVKKVIVTDLTEPMIEDEAIKHAPKNLGAALFFGRNDNKLFIRKRKVYVTKERSWIPFVYKNETKDVTESIYTY